MHGVIPEIASMHETFRQRLHTTRRFTSMHIRYTYGLERMNRGVKVFGGHRALDGVSLADALGSELQSR